MDVLINDNYINQISNHKENMAKRRKRGQNLSIHQFDEATQKQIQETVEQERQNMDSEGLILSTVQMVDDHFTSPPKKEDDINDREEEEKVETDEADNILRSSQEEAETTEKLEEASPQKSDQVSIEIEQPVAVEKRQDYTLINKLFNFLDKPAASVDPKEGLNSTLCGYFSKVVQIMISCDPRELMKYFQENDY